ncbi:MAG: hypothetical protein JW915_11485 [Chitinispirillaceae bacterium]|nr:hypothetical protein [Chitinispirillaceae bacterium]
MQTTIANLHSGNPVWMDKNGILHSGTSVVSGRFSIVDIKGRIIASGLKNGTDGRFNARAGNIYIVNMSDGNRKQMKHWIINGIR